MKVLLDTHALFWWLTSDTRLGERARRLISRKQNVCFASAVSSLELATKLRIGKLDVSHDLIAGLPALVVSSGFTTLPVSFAHGLRAGFLPGEHRDPFDRLLAAQALVESIPIISIDGALDQFGVERIW